MARNDEAKVKFTADTQEFNAGIKEMNGELSGLRAELKLNATQMAGNGRTIDLLTQRQELLGKELDASREKVELLDKKYQAAADTFGEDSEEAQRLARELTNAKNQEQAIANELARTTAEIDDQTDSMKKLSERAGEIGDALQTAGGKISDAGQKLSVVSGAIGAVAGASVKAATTYEDSLAKVSTIADTSAVSMDEMGSAIMDLSNSTGVAAADIADNVYNAISAGQETGDAVNFVSNATKLAKAGFADTGASLDVLTTILNAYGMEASEVEHVSDTLIQTQNLGKTTVAELASSMGKVIPTANSYGVGLEQISTGYAIMTANGVATAESTTYMNSMLNELGKSSTGVSKVIKEKTGKSFKELMDDGATLGEVLEIVGAAAQEQGVSFNDMWSSSEAAKAGVILLGDSASEFNGKLAEMNTSTGATQTAFDKLDTTSNRVNIALNQVKNDAISLGQTLLEDLTPYIEAGAEKVEQFTGWWQGLDDGTKNTIITIGGVVAAIGPLLVILGNVITFVGGVVSAVGTISGFLATHAAAIAAVKAALLGLMTPVVLVPAAIAAVIAVLVTLYKKSENFRNLVNKIGNTIKNVFVQTIPNAFRTVLTAAQNVFGKVFDIIKSPFEKAYDAVKGVIGKITGLFSGAKFSWPKIKTPHFSVQPSGWQVGDLLKGSIPKLGLSWYARGGIATRPTIGGFGEDGAEAILPLERHTGWMDTLADVIEDRFRGGEELDYDRLERMIRHLVDGLSQEITINGREFGRVVRSVR